MENQKEFEIKFYSSEIEKSFNTMQETELRRINNEIWKCKSNKY